MHIFCKYKEKLSVGKDFLCIFCENPIDLHVKTENWGKF